MVTDELITQWYEEEKQLSESYLKGVMDFVKWSSTVGVAAMLWIGNSVVSTTGSPRRIAFAALISIAISLIFAVFTVARALTAWSRKWTLAQETYSYGTFKKWKAFQLSNSAGEEKSMQHKRALELEQKDAEFAEWLLNAVDANKSYSKPVGFSIWTSLHTVFLFLGVSLFVISQIWDML
jgi:hypothetical protein